MVAHRQGDRAARALDLIGELDAGGGRADDEYAAAGELAGIR